MSIDIDNTFYLEQQVSLLFVAFFNRPPDYTGYSFWLNALSSGSSTLQQAANSFGNSQEFQNNYPNFSSDPSGFVDAVYDNLFNRAPDPAGRQFWIAQLNGGATPGDFILAVIGGAQDVQGGDQDRKTVINKIVGAYAMMWAVFDCWTQTQVASSGKSPGQQADFWATTTNQLQTGRVGPMTDDPATVGDQIGEAVAWTRGLNFGG